MENAEDRCDCEGGGDGKVLGEHEWVGGAGFTRQTVIEMIRRDSRIVSDTEVVFCFCSSLTPAF